MHIREASAQGSDCKAVRRALFNVTSCFAILNHIVHHSTRIKVVNKSN